MNHPNFFEWSQEEKDRYASQKLCEMRKQNIKIELHHAKVQHDRRVAEHRNSSVTNSANAQKPGASSERCRPKRVDRNVSRYPREWDRGKESGDWEAHSPKAFKNYRTSDYERRNLRNETRTSARDDRNYRSDHVPDKKNKHYNKNQHNRYDGSSKQSWYQSAESSRKLQHQQDKNKRYFSSDTKHHNKHQSNSSSTDSEYMNDKWNKPRSSNTEASALWHSERLKEDKNKHERCIKWVEDWMPSTLSKLHECNLEKERIPEDEVENTNTSPKRKFEKFETTSDKRLNYDVPIVCSSSRNKPKQSCNLKSRKLDCTYNKSSTKVVQKTQVVRKSYTKFDRINRSDHSSDDSDSNCNLESNKQDYTENNSNLEKELFKCNMKLENEPSEEKTPEETSPEENEEPSNSERKFTESKSESKSSSYNPGSQFVMRSSDNQRYSHDGYVISREFTYSDRGCNEDFKKGSKAKRNPQTNPQYKVRKSYTKFDRINRSDHSSDDSDSNCNLESNKQDYTENNSNLEKEHFKCNMKLENEPSEEKTPEETSPEENEEPSNSERKFTKSKSESKSSSYNPGSQFVKRSSDNQRYSHDGYVISREFTYSDRGCNEDFKKGSKAKRNPQTNPQYKVRKSYTKFDRINRSDHSFDDSDSNCNLESNKQDYTENNSNLEKEHFKCNMKLENEPSEEKTPEETSPEENEEPSNSERKFTESKSESKSSSYNPGSQFVKRSSDNQRYSHDGYVISREFTYSDRGCNEDFKKGSKAKRNPQTNPQYKVRKSYTKFDRINRSDHSFDDSDSNCNLESNKQDYTENNSNLEKEHFKCNMKLENEPSEEKTPEETSPEENEEPSNSERKFTESKSESKSSSYNPGSQFVKRSSDNQRYNPIRKVYSHNDGYVISREFTYSDRRCNEKDFKKGSKGKRNPQTNPQYNPPESCKNEYISKQRKFDTGQSKEALNNQRCKWNRQYFVSSGNKNRSMKAEKCTSDKKRSDFNVVQSLNQDDGGWGYIIQSQVEDEDGCCNTEQSQVDDEDGIWASADQSDIKWEIHEDCNTKQKSAKKNSGGHDKKEAKAFKGKHPIGSDDGWSTVEEGEIRSDDDFEERK